MGSKNMEKGAMIAREAHVALLHLKTYVELAMERTRIAEFDAIGRAVSPRPTGDPLAALKSAADTLHSDSFESAVSDARRKVETAVAWHSTTQH